MACPITNPEEALKLSADLLEMLRSLKREFEAQDPLRKTLAKGDFRKLLGSNIEDWIEKCCNLVSMLKQLQGGIDVDACKLSSASADFEMLSDYFSHLSKVTKQWVKDPEVLSVGMASLAQREATTRNLVAALKPSEHD